MFAAEKISANTARELYARCVQGATANIRNLGYVTLLQKDMQEADERFRLEISVRSRQQPFRAIPEVLQWLEQYTQTRDRYKFLVLGGPSRMGKTRYAASCRGRRAGPPNLRS